MWHMCLAFKTKFDSTFYKNTRQKRSTKTSVNSYDTINLILPQRRDQFYHKYMIHNIFLQTTVIWHVGRVFGNVYEKNP